MIPIDIKDKIEAVGIIVFSVISIGALYENHLDKQNNPTLTDISNQISELQTEIRDLKNSREEYFEKRLQELADEIARIDQEFEEVKYEAESIISEEDVQEAESTSKERLPEGLDTNRYDCEPHTFAAGSDQYWLQMHCLTDDKGLRYFLYNGKKYYCVAMGGAYGIDIGDIWDVTLECGSTFGIILSDYQHPIDVIDPNDFGEIYERDIYGNAIGVLRNYDEEPVCHVLEFVVDMDSLHKSVKMAGTVSALKEFGGLYGDGGNIAEIKYQGRAWNNVA